jgi:hypothetical protein
MSVEKRKIFVKAKKLLCRTAVIALILIPAVMLMVPGCSLFYKCGKPGYTSSGACSAWTVTWSCDSPCSPSISQKTYNATGHSTFNSDTVSCEKDYYETSDGIYLTRYGC